ncbi:MAG: hypothetical protein NTU61_06410, partial [Candidatus Altiarchaeota archaeon]|nr:hypothetical protein [Candidatus Altiarchaeota archaeon]
MQIEGGRKDASAETARQLQAGVAEAARNSGLINSWKAQAERCEAPLGDLIYQYGVRQIIDSGRADEKPTAYSAAVLSKDPGWSNRMTVAATEIPETVGRLPEYTGVELGGEAQVPEDAEWRNVRIHPAPDLARKMGKAHAIARELMEKDQAQLVAIAEEGVGSKRDLFQKARAQAERELAKLGEEPKITAG